MVALLAGTSENIGRGCGGLNSAVGMVGLGRGIVRGTFSGVREAVAKSDWCQASRKMLLYIPASGFNVFPKQHCPFLSFRSTGIEKTGIFLPLMDMAGINPSSGISFLVYCNAHCLTLMRRVITPEGYYTYTYPVPEVLAEPSCESVRTARAFQDNCRREMLEVIYRCCRPNGPRCLFFFDRKVCAANQPR